MKKICFTICIFCLISCNTDKNKRNSAFTNKLNDTILYGKTEDQLPLKTIYYKSKQIDSFKLRVRYINEILKDSMYITDNGFLSKKKVVNLGNGVRKEVEYLNIDGENFTNQFWTIKGKDTLDYGNNYGIRITDFQDKKEGLQVEIFLRLSVNKNFDKLFFIFPKGGDFSKLNSDFSNYREIEYDTIYNLISYKDPSNEGFDYYWSKRTVVFSLKSKENNENYLRGILIEQKDTSYIYKKKDSIKRLERSLFVNEKISKYLKISGN